MPRKYVFVCAEHEEYGGKGWKPTWFKKGDPLPGMTVAHDVLEHLHPHDGTVADEMLAFGAIMYVRGETGWFARGVNVNRRWCDNVAGEIAMMLRDHVDDPWNHDWLPNEAKRANRLDDYLEQEFDEAIRQIVRTALGEGVSRSDLRRCFGERQQDAMRYLWRRGYRKAKGAYQGYQFDLDSIFSDIAKQADDALRYAEEGQELHVFFSRSTRRYSVRLADFADY